MDLVKAYCMAKYYSAFDSASLLEEIQTQLDPAVVELSREFQFIFYQALHTDPCSYWNKDVYNQTISRTAV